ncbi:MAG: response regulator [Epsilonproteobacteria bacterium]|nr:response regulator [Campylobacterota bacterium]
MLKILVVDDTIINVILLEEICKDEGHEVVSFTNPLEALEDIKQHEYDLAFVDYMMPELDGIELIKQIKQIYPNLITVMVTAADNQDVKLKALEAGANEFLTKPIDVSEMIVRLRNISKLIDAEKILKDYNKKLQEEVDRAIQKVIKGEYETLDVLSNVAEYRDENTHNHTKRVAEYSKLIAKEAGLDEEIQELIYYASPLHDIGKVGIPDHILLKPGKLTAEEFEIMKTHTTIGYNMLSGFDNKYLKAGAIIALTHHEKFDGSGYPKGLKGDEIDVMGQIIAIADVFDALTSKRPYKDAWDTQRAFDLIKAEANKHFSPYFVEIFLNHKDKVLQIKEQYQDK